MIEQRELITICRQIGSMMEAGVDILRITRVLRAQVENPEILRAFDTLDHDLRMGQGLSDAMENVPALFSPFAISMVRQGEARNDLAGAFHKIAEFLQKEEVLVAHHPGVEIGGAGSASQKSPVSSARPSALLPVWIINDLINRLQMTALRLFTLAAGLLLTLAGVWASVESGLVERRWQNVVLCSVTALFIGGAGVWLRRRIEKDHQQEIERRKVLEEQAARIPDEPSPPATPVIMETRGDQEQPTFGKIFKAETALKKAAPKANSASEATFE